MTPAEVFAVNPDEFASEDEAKAALTYEEYRIWRAWATGNPIPHRAWRSRKVKPLPGVVDVVDEEAG